MTTADDEVSRWPEVRAPLASRRLRTLTELREAGIPAFAFVGPLLPHFAVHLPVTSEEDRRIFAGNILTAVRAAQPARVVFSTSGFPIDPAIGGAAATLVAGLTDSGVSHAVIAPELYLENLLMPYALDSVRERGVLPYAIRADFPVSWASHLDIADVAVALFERTDVTGVVSVGQYPAITGPGPGRGVRHPAGSTWQAAQFRGRPATPSSAADRPHQDDGAGGEDRLHTGRTSTHHVVC
ncbi:hypothetical protein [Streptomyces coriariae]|uniref:hypothetical protein n=1 Tax=Streptomyces coriariae TaxID=2864460 RepID=UPI001E30F987|nr:hypothetical protein [Streptomyces coriariae]